MMVLGDATGLAAGRGAAGLAWTNGFFSMGCSLLPSVLLGSDTDFTAVTDFSGTSRTGLAAGPGAGDSWGTSVLGPGAGVAAGAGNGIFTRSTVYVGMSGFNRGVLELYHIRPPNRAT